MIDQHWDADNSVLTIRPESPLSEGDFANIAHAVDPTIKRGGDVAGLIIDAPTFPVGTASVRWCPMSGLSTTTTNT
ncbi:hypothetical protein [Mycolicibacterium sp. lyk4-40-TYG-92]|uniref:hypothetical protein n=1 Tax=Mycolicibacterium sp. lyk4-40-TYG-92 TaxID=3040295 RepID=UPI00254A89CF|nr:hypothetical protein [Mycolicibacterium sp. lyk4-40-TYG-92]